MELSSKDLKDADCHENEQLTKLDYVQRGCLSTLPETSSDSIRQSSICIHQLQRQKHEGSYLNIQNNETSMQAPCSSLEHHDCDAESVDASLKQLTFCDEAIKTKELHDGMNIPVQESLGEVESDMHFSEDFHCSTALPTPSSDSSATTDEKNTKLRCKLCFYSTYSLKRFKKHEARHTIGELFEGKNTLKYKVKKKFNKVSDKLECLKNMLYEKCKSRNKQFRVGEESEAKLVSNSQGAAFSEEQDIINVSNIEGGNELETTLLPIPDEIEVSVPIDSEQESIISNSSENSNNKQKIHQSKQRENKVYKCQLCEYKSRYKACFIKHKSKHDSLELCEEPEDEKHSEETECEKIFTCEECRYSTPSMERFYKHKKVHLKERKYACPQCDYRSRFRADLCKHKAKHSTDKKYKCPECDFTTKWRRNVSLHKMTHVTERPFTCDLCGHTFKRKQDLSYHMFRHSDEKPIQCDQCDFRCKTNYEVQCHKLKHSDERKFSCPFPDCTQKTKTKSDLRKHLRIHSNDKSYICKVCGKGFIHTGSLNKHMVTHITKKNYNCGICDKWFKTKAGLRNHTLLHDGIKPYECDQCMKLFANKYNMQKHREIHFGNRPFKCPVCTYGARNPDHLLAHIGSNHGQSHAYFCELCMKPFKRYGHLQTHLRRMHPDANNDIGGMKTESDLPVHVIKIETADEETVAMMNFKLNRSSGRDPVNCLMDEIIEKIISEETTEAPLEGLTSYASVKLEHLDHAEETEAFYKATDLDYAQDLERRSTSQSAVETTSRNAIITNTDLLCATNTQSTNNTGNIADQSERIQEFRLPLATKGFKFNLQKKGKKPKSWFMNLQNMDEEMAAKHRAYLKRKEIESKRINKGKRASRGRPKGSKNMKKEYSSDEIETELLYNSVASGFTKCVENEMEEVLAKSLIEPSTCVETEILNEICENKLDIASVATLSNEIRNEVSEMFSEKREIKRTRGRPKKLKDATSAVIAPEKSNESTEKTVKRARGRPKGVKTVSKKSFYGEDSKAFHADVIQNFDPFPVLQDATSKLCKNVIKKRRKGFKYTKKKTPSNMNSQFVIETLRTVLTPVQSIEVKQEVDNMDNTSASLMNTLVPEHNCLTTPLLHKGKILKLKKKGRKDKQSLKLKIKIGRFQDKERYKVFSCSEPNMKRKPGRPKGSLSKHHKRLFADKSSVAGDKCANLVNVKEKPPFTQTERSKPYLFKQDGKDFKIMDIHVNLEPLNLQNMALSNPSTSHNNAVNAFLAEVDESLANIYPIDVKIKEEIMDDQISEQLCVENLNSSLSLYRCKTEHEHESESSQLFVSPNAMDQPLHNESEKSIIKNVSTIGSKAPALLESCNSDGRHSEGRASYGNNVSYNNNSDITPEGNNDPDMFTLCLSDAISTSAPRNYMSVVEKSPKQRDDMRSLNTNPYQLENMTYSVEQDSDVSVQKLSYQGSIEGNCCRMNDNDKDRDGWPVHEGHCGSDRPKERVEALETNIGSIPVTATADDAMLVYEYEVGKKLY